MVIVTLPAYNEARTLPPLLAALEDALQESSIEYRVVVVNDGSKDETGAVVKDLARSLPITLVEHERNCGLGDSLRTGLQVALREATDRDIIVTMDADNTHGPGLILRMIRNIREGNDVVIASRYQPGAHLKGVPRYRRALSWGASMLFRLAFPTRNVRDFTSGYRAYRAGTLRRAFDHYGDEFVAQSGFSCMVDILLKLRDLDAIMSEVPLILRYDLKPDVSKMLVMNTIRDTLVLAVRRRFGRAR